MDPRELLNSNGYLGPGVFSVGLRNGNFLTDNNWGVAVWPAVTVFQMPTYHQMSRFANEFALMHDDLLRDLAR
jgi:hypothetical protein